LAVSLKVCFSFVQEKGENEPATGPNSAFFDFTHIKEPLFSVIEYVSTPTLSVNAAQVWLFFSRAFCLLCRLERDASFDVDTGSYFVCEKGGADAATLIVPTGYDPILLPPPLQSREN
jgi:hypothetical protein